VAVRPALPRFPALTKVAAMKLLRRSKALPGWLGPAIWGLAVICVFVAYLGLVRQSIQSTRDREAGLDARLVGESARLHLATNRDYLVMLADERAAGSLDAGSFQERAAGFVADHPELICINWVEADYVITDIAPRAGNEHIIGLPLDLPEPHRASRLAVAERRPVYTRPFDVIQGARAFELWVPVFEGEDFLGLMGAIYSYERLLQVVASPAVRGRNLVSVVQADGETILELAAAGAVDRKRAQKIELTPAENGAFLKLAPYGRGIPDRVMYFLELVCLALVLGMALAMWRLRREVDGHRRTELALRASEAKARSIVDNVGVGVSVVGPAMELLEANPLLREWFPEINTAPHPRRRRWYCDLPCEDVCDDCPVALTLRDGRTHEGMKTVAREGAMRSFHLVSSPVLSEAGEVTAVIEIVEDVTERLALEAQLSQTQKMEAVGRLAGGVAHDFNNMLQVIQGHAELALDGCSPDDPRCEDVQQIRAAAERSASLVGQLLAFARRQVAAPRTLDLNQTIDGTISLLRRLIGENIDLSWQPGAEVWPIRIDPTQLDQILTNLCVNARDAINGTGHIAIETGVVTFDQAWCAANPDCLPGDYALLTVSDDGSGMDRETQARLFEPFFTTKTLGRGTGLGLATVYGIVRQNDGFIKVYSEPAVGTTFRVYLPRRAAGDVAIPAPESLQPLPHGNEVLLLVEDEPRLLDMARTMLERLGYRVLAAASPDAALEAAAEHAGTVDLLVTDVIMPGMDGRELSDQLRALRPGLKTLFISGYPGSIIDTHGVLEPGVRFLPKPFTARGLANAVRQALDPASDSPGEQPH
jgi:signal transduction histidine kinase/sensor domain CHASE-containing protein/ActR/RegA family two-component response regulator